MNLAVSQSQALYAFPSLVIRRRPFPNTPMLAQGPGAAQRTWQDVGLCCTCLPGRGPAPHRPPPPFPTPKQASNTPALPDQVRGAGSHGVLRLLAARHLTPHQVLQHILATRRHHQPLADKGTWVLQRAQALPKPSLQRDGWLGEHRLEVHITH